MPETLDDLYQTGSRQEGQICELRAPPHHKFVHGFISVPCTPEQLFFHQSPSGIPKRKTCNIRMDTIVQFKVQGKNNASPNPHCTVHERFYFFFIRYVHILILSRSYSLPNPFVIVVFEEKTVGCF